MPSACVRRAELGWLAAGARERRDRFGAESTGGPALVAIAAVFVFLALELAPSPLRCLGCAVTYATDTHPVRAVIADTALVDAAVAAAVRPRRVDGARR